jgi:pilus assembly protein CpaD
MQPRLARDAAPLGADGLSVTLGACNTRGVVTADVPNDYRQRHPIAVQEAKQLDRGFVGQARGGLSAAQRADVAGIARTGCAKAPARRRRRARRHAECARGRGDLSGNPPCSQPAACRRAHRQHPYRPEDPGLLPTIRLGYSRIAAVAGPCGLWPEDIGPSILDPGYNENHPYFNLGCASQRNLAAMIDNPADLEQPRAETPVYTARRDMAFERYRKGTPVATPNPEADKAKLSDTGR